MASPISALRRTQGMASQSAHRGYGSPTMIEEDATLEVDGVRIPGRIARGEAPARAAILLLPGSLFSDVDGDYPTWGAHPHTLRDLAHQFAALGIASMR